MFDFFLCIYFINNESAMKIAIVSSKIISKMHSFKQL